MKHKIHRPRDENVLADILPDEFEIRIVTQVGDIFRRSGDGIINGDDAEVRVLNLSKLRKTADLDARARP